MTLLTVAVTSPVLGPAAVLGALTICDQAGLEEMVKNEGCVSLASASRSG